MMPIGYELGFRRGLHVVETRPEHWEEPSFDIRDFIGRVNRMKAETPVLNEEGRQERFTKVDEPVVGLLRESQQQAQRCAVLINPTPTRRKRTAAISSSRSSTALRSSCRRSRRPSTSAITRRPQKQPKRLPLTTTRHPRSTCRQGICASSSPTTDAVGLALAHAGRRKKFGG